MSEAAVMYAESGLSETNSPLVSVSFQRDEQRKLKFLEGEPKVLGITQICLIIFHVSCLATFYSSGLTKYYLETPIFISSGFVFIAGIVAIAAKNLHFPTLRACLGMEVLSSVASLVILILTLLQMESYYSCYTYDGKKKPYCQNGEDARLHLLAELVVIQVTLLAISITLIVYACKVVNCCCGPAPKVPVITIQAPPPRQEEQLETRP